MIYRGAGIMTLLTPIIVLLCLTALWPGAATASGDVSLKSFLYGTIIGSVLNTVAGFIVNRETDEHGARHHFFFIPMQWPSLAIALVCTVIAIIKL